MKDKVKTNRCPVCRLARDADGQEQHLKNCPVPKMKWTPEKDLR